MSVIAYLGLGSNLGDREENLRRALRLLGDEPGVRLLRVSPLYETDPVGYTEQDPFLNAVAEVETTLDPHQLLSWVLDIERRLGRVRSVRWGPRTIDIDILLYNNLVMRDKDLEIPHPRMWQRGFVLVPLADLNADIAVPSPPAPGCCNGGVQGSSGTGARTVRDLLAGGRLKEDVRLYKRAWI
ncbi:MAG TPA: 2-amino-4-hydroxy-6-hydroxymethyldihydropteridine diphosphokinase [Firmicutes bacterium]|nr:2-amino-4-hydroxy-6-hydroxymethyldihydropteridine diphosphokinase [Bacillota bacterium]